MKVRDLTEQQQQDFQDAFYFYMPQDDRESPNPWGCPWYWAQDDELEGQDIEDMADFWWNKHKKEILESLQEAEQMQKELGQ